MGVPKFFAFISRRYPCIMELIKDGQIPDFDNFYLDMNGIIHICSHQGDAINFNIDEKKIFSTIFHYLDVLVHMIKPRKLLFLAVDGVAPRAKINQQRGRRFKSARDAEILMKKYESEGLATPDTPRFDPNCITPGTEFMTKLHAQLQYYVTSRISTNPLWQNVKVILSGHQVPGEGEHKIMEYIRYEKSLPDYDPCSKHCLYGLDADLIMLGLCSRIRNFSLLREEVKFGKKNSFVPVSDIRFYLLHLSILRDYIDLEFQDLKNVLTFEYDKEKIVDDWILMGFLVGNDFIPHCPNFHIAKGAFPVLYKTYSVVLPTLDGYLNENGHLNLPRFQKFMERLAKYEIDTFEETSPNFALLEEKTERKESAEKNKENGKPRDEKLENLIRMTNEAFRMSDDESNEEDYEDNFDAVGETDYEILRDIFLKEFCQHKMDYYANKLDYLKVTDDVIKSEAEGYIRAVQWLLHYYYHGCQSWSWFYPHHYAPYMSDIVKFKDVNLDFEMGRPFLPFEQLLAILPPLSVDLVPKAYQNLLISEDSPIKEFYPDKFETDLNGKLHEWEAVVLLPFVDEKVLLKAMEDGNTKLTKEETLRNKHGPMEIYVFTEEDLGEYRVSEHFPSIPENHASIKTMWRGELCVDSSKNNVNSKHDVDPDLYFPGFPTLRFIDFKAQGSKGKRIYGEYVREENILLHIEEKEVLETVKLASELLGKIIYVNWPYLKEARVIALADDKYNYSLNKAKENGIQKEQLDEEGRKNWTNTVASLTSHSLENNGIVLGETKVIVYVNVLEGRQQTFESLQVASCIKVWSDLVETYPLQTTVKDIKVYESEYFIHKTVEEIFPTGSVVFMLGFPYYGCKGKIRSRRDSDKSNTGRLQVRFEVPNDHRFDRNTLNPSSTTFFSAFTAGQKIGISKYLVAKISGSILINMSSRENSIKSGHIVNIGLQLKYTKENKEVPGYTIKSPYWKYSNKAIDLINEYTIRFPSVVSYLSDCSKNDPVFSRHDIFPDPDGAKKVEEIKKWIKNLESSKIEPVVCGSEILEKEVVEKMEAIINRIPKEFSYKSISVKPNFLFKSDLISSSLPPVTSANHQLLDRVINVGSTYTIPLGLRGYIIGIRKAQLLQDYMYDILYDEPFPGGMTLNCSPGRGCRTSRTSFINISHGERAYKLVKQPKSSHSEFFGLLNSSGMLNKERPSSAFAQWNHYPPAPLYEDRAEQFKSLWSSLEKVKSQDETKVLKKILKIEEEEKPKIEDNVKIFFENISKNTEKMIPKTNISDLENVKIILQKFQRQPEKSYLLQLLKYFQNKNLGQPKFQLMEVCHKIRSQVIFPDGRVYLGFPCQDVESAYDSAALQALGALGEVQLSNAHPVQKESERTRKVVENEPKADKYIYMSVDNQKNTAIFDAAKPMVNVKSKIPNDKSNRNNKPLQQNHRRNSVPQVLPTPPLLWCRQYKNTPNDYKEEYKLRPEMMGKCDYVAGRVQNENLVQAVHSGECQSRNRVDLSNNFRNQNRRQQNEIRSGNEYFRHNNWRQRSNQSDQVQSGHVRPEMYQIKQGNISCAHDKITLENSQAGPSGTCQRLSAVATEFIPLQALARNRNRANTATVARQENKEATKVLPPNSPKKIIISPRKEEATPIKSMRKSKIAAKFDTEWDLQE